MQQEVKNLDTVLDALKDCVEACKGTKGVAVLSLASYPGENNAEQNVDLTYGFAEDVIICLLKAMARHDLIKKIILTAAGSYRTFNTIMGDTIRNSD